MIKNVAISTGISKTGQEQASKILAALPNIDSICIDVVNGYTRSSVDSTRVTRARHPKTTIMVGNVAAREMVEEDL